LPLKVGTQTRTLLYPRKTQSSKTFFVSRFYCTYSRRTWKRT